MRARPTSKIIRIVTPLRAAVARHRFGRTAVVVAALYLTVCAAAAAYGGVFLLGQFVTGMVWPCRTSCGRCSQRAAGSTRGCCGRRCAAPLSPAPAPARPVVWLRRLLYADVAGDLLLWELADELSGRAVYVVRQAVWAATLVLLVRTLSGVTPRFRVIAIGLGLGGVLGALLRLWPGGPYVSWLPLLVLGARAMILIGQRRDGRWSAATVRFGWVALLAPSAFALPRAALGRGEALDGLDLVADVLGGLSIVWAARTANELTAPPANAVPPAGSRLPRSLVAAVLMLPLAVVGAEQGVRLTYTGADDGCRDRIRPVAAAGPEERREAFLCLARHDTFAGGTMFPEDLPDQRILARAEKLCAQAGDSERMALYQRDGRADAVELAQALEYLCPGIVARQTADAARRQAEQDRELAAWQAESNARCADPWPGARARRQGTAAYSLSEGGGYTVFDDRDGTGDEPDRFEVPEDGFIAVAGSGAVVATRADLATMCLTVKAFLAAPPLRLTGWDEVVEVGILSRSGRLVVPPYPEDGGSGALRPLPDLAVGGPGHYRLRVHTRLLEWDEDDPGAPEEEHLVVVFPGGSAEKVVHRSRG
ncbi:hypothetical protein SMD20_08200 [Nonomuraea sp. LP-02]|uniref:hypothetical protein n=1 Tax=Nonomuraea sp. LP-02 TaxID=3097960 RepID=UPI002E3671A4|nr:hypothetical protein [Nonomuraea sp. LP-02]MED7924210.1 hypothetical protein [Nonomuraea sp. LP-02]